MNAQTQGFTTAGLTVEGNEVKEPKKKGFTTEGAIVKTKTEDDYVVDPDFIADAKTLAPYLDLIDTNKGADNYMASIQGSPIIGDRGIGIDEMQAGMDAAQESYVPEDTEFSESLFENAGSVQWNFTRLGITAAQISEWPEEAQMALIRTMKTYDAVPFEKRHAWRAANNIIQDPTTYTGFGIFAKAMSKVAMKQGASALLKSLVSKPVVVGTAVAGLEGSAYMAGDNIFRQSIDNQGDFSKTDYVEVAKDGAIGFGFGGGLGFLLTKYLSPKATRGATNDTDVEPPLAASEETLALDGPAVSPAEAPPNVTVSRLDGEPVQGELLDDGLGTNVSTNAERGAMDETTPNYDGDVDSLNNAEEIPTNDVGEDWTHLYEGDQTFNVDRLETSDDVKGFVESVSAQLEKHSLADDIETLEQARTSTAAEAERFKDETGGDISKILEQYKDDHAELKKIRFRTQALRQLNVALGERVFELAWKKHLGELTEAEAAEFIEKAGLFANTMELTKLASREFSRGLGNYRMIMKGDPTLMEGLKTGMASGDINALSKTIISMTEAGKGKMVNGKMVKGKVNLKALKKSMEKGNIQNALDSWIRFRSAMMLSGPSTIEAAGLSNLAKLWSDPFFEWWGHIGRGAAKKSGRVRAMAQYAGNRRFFFSSWKQAASAWKKGQHISDPFVTKVEGQLDQSLQNMSWLRRNVWERGVHQAHLALLFLDEGIKANRSRSLIYADTVVEAAKAGIPPKGVKFEELLNQNLLAKIDPNGAIRDKEILREVREATYTSDLEGSIGKIFNTVASMGGGAGRLIAIPFIRAPINIVSEGMMYFPFTQLFLAKQKNILKSGSPIAKAKLKARKQLGLAAIGALYYAAEEGLYTGSGPSDHKQRELMKLTGWQPHSIRVGEEWVSYAKLGPMSLLLGVVADINYIANMDTNGTNVDEGLTSYAAQVGFAVTNNVLNKAYFSSVTQLMDALQNPDAGEKFVHSWILSHTPNILSQMNSDPNVREATDLMEKLNRRLPILSEKLGKQYDFLGREILKPKHDIPFYGYMFKNVSIVKDPVADEVFSLSRGLDRAILDKPAYGLGITQTDYREVYDYGETESVYAKFNRTVGEMKDPYNGNSLHEALAELISSEDYQNAPHSTAGDITPPKVQMIKSIVNAYRNMAKQNLHTNSRAFRQKERERNSRVDAIFTL